MKSRGETSSDSSETDDVIVGLEQVQRSSSTFPHYTNSHFSLKEFLKRCSVGRFTEQIKWELRRSALHRELYLETQ